MACFYVSRCCENALRSSFTWADVAWHRRRSWFPCFGWLTARTHGSIYGSVAAVIHDLVHVQGCASVIRPAKQDCAKDVEKKTERERDSGSTLFCLVYWRVLDGNWSICSRKEHTYGGLTTASHCFMAIPFRPTYIIIAFVTPGSLIYANTHNECIVLTSSRPPLWNVHCCGSQTEYEFH